MKQRSGVFCYTFSLLEHVAAVPDSVRILSAEHRIGCVAGSLIFGDFVVAGANNAGADGRTF